MKKLISVIFLALVILLLNNKAYARSGCCSHHGGVCGCGCCDGTGLSATCAPYYPQCNSVPSTKVAPVVPTTPKCTANSYYDSTDKQCHCNSGYCVNTSKSGCVLLPANAHCVDSTSDAWQCDSGYEEKSDYCAVAKIEQRPTIKYVETTTESTTSTESVLSGDTVNSIDATKAPAKSSNGDDGNWLIGLVTLGGIYVGKKYLDRKKNKKQTEV